MTRRYPVPAARRIRWGDLRAAGLLLVGVPGAASANDVIVGTTSPNGTLEINGDQDANEITITESNGTITITGNRNTHDSKCQPVVRPYPCTTTGKSCQNHECMRRA